MVPFLYVVSSSLKDQAALFSYPPEWIPKEPTLDNYRALWSDVYLEHELSVGVSIVLMLTYLSHLVFSLVTHKSLFNPTQEDPHEVEDVWGARTATGVLIVATVLVALMSEVLVGAVEQASHVLGMNQVFVGVVIVAIVGNAAEHSTAILVALKNQMDLSVGIAVGSALQIALFVAPVLVFASYLRPEPMDLRFTSLEVLAVLLGVFTARMVAEDGESNWLEGMLLLMIYAILALAFFFLPERPRAEGRHKAGAGHARAWRGVEGEPSFAIGEGLRPHGSGAC